MLVLTQKVSEDIVILVNDQIIEVNLMEVLNGHAKVGFTADKSVTILRKSLYLKGKGVKA